MSRSHCLIAGMIGLFVGAAQGFSEAVPHVSKVEPPNWWVGHTRNPVRLLITGDNLSGATVKAPPGFVTDSVRVSEHGDYLFVDLFIPGNGQPGPVPLRVITGSGEAPAPFELLPKLSRTGRFQGLSTDDVIYLLMTDRFANGDRKNDDPSGSPGLLDRNKPRHYHGGDFQGVLQHLDYLRELGVSTIWLTPWYDNANQLNYFEKYTRENELSDQGVPSTDYHGYGAVDFYAVEEHFGDLQLLQKLVSRAHAAGMKVMQDQVANHTGPTHAWVQQPPTPTWFNGSAADHLANSWQIWTTTVSNPPPDQLQSTLEGWFIDILPDLDQNDPEVATYLIQNSVWWADITGLDAIRQDTLPYVPRRFWAQWTTAVKREHSNLTILGELLDGNPQVVSFFQGGRAQFDGIDTGIDTLFDFPLYFAIRDVFANGQPVEKLTATLAADTNYVDPSVLVTFLGLHDKPRFLYEPGATIEGLRLAFDFLLTTRGTPMIYYGDEIAMDGGKDPYNRRDFPGGWPEDAQNAFEPGSRTPEQQAMHDHVCTLLKLRRELVPLRRGRQVNLSVGTNTYAYARATRDAYVVVALNNSKSAQRMEFSVAGLTGQPVQAVKDRLGALGSLDVEGGLIAFTLPPQSAALLTPEPLIVQARNADNELSKPSEIRQIKE